MNTLAIRQTLANAGPRKAELQLALLGDNQGDDQVAIIVSELTHAEVSQLLAEGDYTKPSIVAHHLTPEQLLGALQRLGAKWGNLRGAETETLLPLKEQIGDFMLSALLHGNEKAQKELIEIILDDSLAEDVLVAIALFEPGCPEFLKEKDWGTVQHGTWQELYMRIRELSPPAFTRLSKEVTSLFETEDDREEDNDNDEEEAPMPRKAERFLRRTLTALVKKADDLGDAVPADKKAKPSLRIFKSSMKQKNPTSAPIAGQNPLEDLKADLLRLRRAILRRSGNR